MDLLLLRDLQVEQAMASGHAFLSAASGLVCLGERLCVIADDENQLALFPADMTAPGALIRLQPGALPRDAAKRKASKPDFEILLHLPVDAGFGPCALLALGSCSTPQRTRGALVQLATDQHSAADIRIIDLRPLYAALSPHVAEVNLEGALVDGDRLLLFNRGNMRTPETQIFKTGLSALLQGADMEAEEIKRLKLPTVHGVALTVTDACKMPDCTILLSAVAEATDDSYNDGVLEGSAIVRLDSGFDIIGVEMLDPPVKVEGIAVRPFAEGLEMLCVTDADDPDRPSGLYRAELKPA